MPPSPRVRNSASQIWFVSLATIAILSACTNSRARGHPMTRQAEAHASSPPPSVQKRQDPPALMGLTVSPVQSLIAPGGVARIVTHTQQSPNAPPATVVFSVDSAGIATVDSVGTVVGHSIGTANVTVTATAGQGGGFSASRLTATVKIVVRAP